MTANTKTNFKQYSTIVVAVSLTFCANILFSSWQKKEAKLEKGASVEYVDSKDSEIKEILKNKADSKDLINVLEMVKDNNDKINFLYQEAIKKNRK